MNIVYIGYFNMGQGYRLYRVIPANIITYIYFRVLVKAHARQQNIFNRVLLF